MRMKLVRQLPLLHPDEEIESTAALYVRHKLMPRDLPGDALHLALASHYDCDALVTWNYHHLANPNKLDRIRRLNEDLGLSVPRIVTPSNLIGGNS
jgi:predicted nucleic acid-binding protein